MKESFLIEIEKDQLTQAIQLSDKRGCSLSQLIAASLDLVFTGEKGEYQCPNRSIQGVCIQNLSTFSTLEEAKTDLEIKMIKRALVAHTNASRAADCLGIGKSCISQKMKKYDLDKYTVIKEHDKKPNL
jgi:transcriptional regulator with PAS, ATPase and Fis domain